jgi:hypothetical protein
VPIVIMDHVFFCLAQCSFCLFKCACHSICEFIYRFHM